MLKAVKPKSKRFPRGPRLRHPSPLRPHLSESINPAEPAEKGSNEKLMGQWYRIRK